MPLSAVTMSTATVSTAIQGGSPETFAPRSITACTNITLDDASDLPRNLQDVTSCLGSITIQSNDPARRWMITGDISACSNIILRQVTHTGRKIESLFGSVSIQNCVVGDRVQANKNIMLNQVYQKFAGRIISNFNDVSIAHSSVGEIKAFKEIKIDARSKTGKNPSLYSPLRHALPAEEIKISDVRGVGDNIYLAPNTVLLGQRVTQENARRLIAEAKARGVFILPTKG